LYAFFYREDITYNIPGPGGGLAPGGGTGCGGGPTEGYGTKKCKRIAIQHDVNLPT